MRVIKLVALGLLAWPAVEIVAFIFAAAVIGFANAVFLILLMSFAGLCVVRHFGGDVTRIRTAAGTGIAAEAWGTGTAGSVGGLLLLIPGFVTSVLGIIVLLPVSRRWLLAGCRRMLAAGRQPADSKIVDLAPDEWRSLPGARLPSPGGPPTN
jgi:UPF0716 family protein affecting phage T7 exclusion